MAEASEAHITEIDISRPSRALWMLRWSEYLMVMTCGMAAVSVIVNTLPAAATGRWTEVVAGAVLAPAFGLLALAGWRHVGVINPRAWRMFLWVLPLLLVVGALLGLFLGAIYVLPGQTFNLAVFLGTLWQFGVPAILGLVALRMLAISRVGPERVPAAALLTDLARKGGLPAQGAANVERVNPRRGTILALLGAVFLIGPMLVPVSDDPMEAVQTQRMLNALTLPAFFLFVRSRRYFQIKADGLLAVDKRPPILFLRSFADDARLQVMDVQRALLDFSLETRLANHFMRFGPFIAIGSPKDTVPQPGAARVLLSDEEWQERVLGWMREASVIVMYCGTTRWVNWELRQVIEAGRTTSLILMFPEIRGWRWWRRKGNIAARAEQIREVFRHTPWTEELTEFAAFADLRAMLFREDGSMVMVRSRSRRRDAYHLAALVAHAEMVGTAAVAEPSDLPTSEALPRRWPARGLAAAGVAAAIAAVAFLGLDEGNWPAQAGFGALGPLESREVAFGRGHVIYAPPITEVEATRVGEYMDRQEFVSADAPETVLLTSTRDGLRMKFAIDRASADNPRVAIQLGVLGGNIAREVLDGRPIEVQLVTHLMEPIGALPASWLQMFQAGQLYYTDPVTAEEAGAVGTLLESIEYFDDTPASVHLGREDGVTHMRFVSNPAALTDEELDGLYAIGGWVAGMAVLGPVVVHASDPDFRTIHQRQLNQ